VQGAFADVENALIAQQKSRARLQAQQGLVDALSDYARLARLQYNGGYVPYSTVLQAEQQLFPAQLTLAQDRAQVFGAVVSVYQSLGGGWVTLADGMTTPSTTARPWRPHPRHAASQSVRCSMSRATTPGLAGVLRALSGWPVVIALMHPALAQQPSSEQASAIRQACRSDYAAVCSGVPTVERPRWIA